MRPLLSSPLLLVLLTAAAPARRPEPEVHGALDGDSVDTALSLDVVTAFWFAWGSFCPNTEVVD